MSYYTSPSFDDPRVLTQTMAAVDVAMDVETLRRQEKPGMPTNGMPLEDRKLNDDLRLAALRQLKFREIHGLFVAKFQAQARMYLLSFLSQPLQVAVQSIQCPYRMYMYLQDRFESATMTAIDVLRVILTAFSHDDHDQIDQHRILSLHFDRMDRLMTRLKSSIQPVDWAAMSVLDYDRHVWDSLHALLLRHSFRDITMDNLPPRPRPLLCPNGSTSEVDRTMSHIYHVLGHPAVASPSHTPLNHDMPPSKPIPDENPTSPEPTEYANASTTNDPVVSRQQQVQHFHTDDVLIKVEPAQQAV
ncbi:hypothetical protein DYB35_007971 [Aphanomyces astaci]|uniref:Uncharacterized protein n=1 Tax=Aphanomyces astaci TaxID=112090 RepID=A0A3R6ZGR3_APHAT|nr:hypothetical protein DYB35_007971 [Aphanomyces astaci]